ncbi:MAG: hypothetical protein ACPG4T_22750 [Nannocystaceae bacterium]
MTTGRILVKSHVGDGAALVCAARGDRKGLRQLFERYSSVVLGVCQRVLGDHARSETVCAAVFLDVWKTARASSPDRPLTDSLPLLLLQRSRALALEVLSQGQHARMVSMDDTQMSMKLASSSSRMGPARASVRTTMAGLTGHQRSMLQLAYFEGLDKTQIAQRAGMTEDEVIEKVADGMRQLLPEGEAKASVVAMQVAHRAARYVLGDLNAQEAGNLEAQLTAERPEFDALRALDVAHALALYTLPIGPSVVVWDEIDANVTAQAAS